MAWEAIPANEMAFPEATLQGAKVREPFLHRRLPQQKTGPCDSVQIWDCSGNSAPTKIEVTYWMVESHVRTGAQHTGEQVVDGTSEG